MTPFLIHDVFFDLSELKREIDSIQEWNYEHNYTSFYYKPPKVELKLGSYYLWNYCGRPLENKFESMSSHPVKGWENFPIVRKINDQIPGETDLIKVTKLYPGSIIPIHRDWLGSPHRVQTARFHISVYTHSLCTCRVVDPNGNTYYICTEEGTLWYLHTRWQHEYKNDSPIPRINLIIDKKIDPIVKSFIDFLMPH